MQEEYTGTLLEDGHISIPPEIVNRLQIRKGSKLRIRVEPEKTSNKDRILHYAGLLSDLSDEEEKKFEESVQRRSLLSSLRTAFRHELLDFRQKKGMSARPAPRKLGILAMKMIF